MKKLIEFGGHGFSLEENRENGRTAIISVHHVNHSVVEHDLLRMLAEIPKNYAVKVVLYIDEKDLPSISEIIKKKRSLIKLKKEEIEVLENEISNYERGDMYGKRR
ncbi:MAG: hypothetical protein N2V78_09185 [Methanophagales archaeon]|nr:hypothetical protein [Methanophagales archaeon]